MQPDPLNSDGFVELVADPPTTRLLELELALPRRPARSLRDAIDFYGAELVERAIEWDPTPAAARVRGPLIRAWRIEGMRFSAIATLLNVDHRSVAYVAHNQPRLRRKRPVRCEAIGVALAETRAGNQRRGAA